MEEKMFRWAHHLRNRIDALEKITSNEPFIIRALLVVLIFLLYIALGVLYSFLVLFGKSTSNFSFFYTIRPKTGYHHSYTSFQRWHNNVRFSTVAAFLLAILITTSFSVIYGGGGLPANAAACAISTNTTIDSSYITTNDCATITISGSPTITWSGTTDLVGNGTVTVQGGGTVTFSGAASLGTTDDMTITGSTTVTHVVANTTGVNISARSLTIDSGSTINVNTKGCAGTSGANGSAPNGSGVCGTNTGYGDYSTSGGGGAGHGGAGGVSSDGTAGGTYDTNTAPLFFGASGGGGQGQTGGAGGGLVRIDTSGTFTLNGTVTANAGNGTGSGYASGGGAGGSIYVTTPTLAGSGSMTANGGNGGDGSGYDGGGGGGGRIAVYYDTNSSFTLSNITADKGTKGGAGQGSVTDGANGSVFILNRETDDGSGNLRINSGLDFTSSIDVARTTITIANGANLTCGTFSDLTLGATGTLTFGENSGSTGVTWTCTTVTNIVISAGTWTSAGTAHTLNFDKVGSTVDWDISNDLTLTNYTITGAAGGTSGNGSAFSMDNAIDVSLVSTTINANLNWTSLDSLNIDAGSSVNANSKGCFGAEAVNGYGPNGSGVCTSGGSGYGDYADGGGGAGHGGAGGKSTQNITGATYDSNTAPVLLGASGGGGPGVTGGKGGGKIRLGVTGALTINGAISANGAVGTTGSYGSGGGAGGSVYLTAITLDGSGSINARGGNGSDGIYDGSGGGGGRISIYYATNSSSFLSGLSTTTHTVGGTKGGVDMQDGSAGTINTTQYSAPSAPTISAPTAGATGQSRGLTVTTSAYSSDGAPHTTTDWQISDDNTFSNSDCSDANVVYCSLTSSNKESAVVNSTNGTFQNGLNGAGALNGTTTYYVRARHRNGAGASSWSSSVSFTTTANAAPSTPTNSAPANAETGVSKNPTLSSSAFSDSDNDTHLNSDWLVYEASDCSGTADWSKSTDATNKTSIVVNTTNGTFADALAGKTTLKAHTQYSFKVVYRDSGSAASSASSCTSFTTTNTAPTLDSSISDVTLLEDNSSVGAFDLDTFFSDVDFNDDDAYNCTASNGLSAGLGTMTINGNRTVDFSLTANANGSDTIQFSCADGGSLSTSSNTVTVTVTAVNDVPSFTKGSNQTVLEDVSAQTVTGWATSLSKGPADESSQTLSFTVTNDNNALFSSQPAVASNGNLTFTPTSNTNGLATVTIYVSDNGGTANGGDDASDTQTFTITVTSVNDVPSFTKGANQTVLEDASAQSVTGWATSLSKGPSDESGQTLSFTVTNDSNSLFSSQPAVASNGSLTYTPAANATGTATVSVSIVDNGGTDNSGDDTSDAQTFTITLTAVNDVPSFTKGSNQTVLEDAGAQSFTGWATSVSAGPSNESAQTLTFSTSNNNNSLFTSQPAVASNGNLTFTPASNANGSATVTIAITDNGGTDNSGDDTSDAQTFTITVTAVNDTPSFTKGDNVTINEDAGVQSISAWAINISSGPTDESAQTNTFTVAATDASLFTSQPALSASGALSFTPAENMNGSTTVTVSLADNGGTDNGGDDTSDTQIFTVTLTSVNDLPQLSQTPDQTINESDTLTIELSTSDVETPVVTLSATDTDEDFADAAVDVSTLFTDNGDNTGTFEWTPSYTTAGTYALSFTATDEDDGVSTDDMIITVNNVNSAPVFTGNLPSISFLSGTTTTAVFDLDDYFSDREGDAMTYAVTGAQNLGVNIADGAVTLTADTSFSGTEALVFTATDTDGEVGSSNEVVVIVEPAETAISISDVSHVAGETKGAGEVTIIGQDGVVLASWTAFPQGGVIPRIAAVDDNYYVFAVKRRSGSTIHAYTLSGQIVTKKRLSPNLHWRKLAVGNLDNNKTTEEIVVGTRRGKSVYFKIFTFNPEKKTFGLRKIARYRGVKTNKFALSVLQKNVHLIINGKTKLDWKPF